MGNDNVKDYPPYLDYPKPRKPITNADRIRSMTGEELAEAFAMQCAGRVCKGIPFDGKNECVNCWLDWLKQEAVSDG